MRPSARSTRIGAAFVVLLAVTIAVGSVIVGLTPGDGTTFDEAVLDTFHRGRTPALSRAWAVLTHAGDTLLLLPAAVAIGLAWRARRGDWLALELLVGAYLGAMLLHNVAKPIVGRERPAADLAFTAETGLAFPSGHASQASAFWVALALLALVAVTSRVAQVAVAAAAATVVVLVAVSRLYLGAHWVTDVVAGTLLGTSWAGALAWSLWTTGAGPDRAVRADRS